MPRKKQSSGEDSNEPYLKTNHNPELEKKIDELLSLEPEEDTAKDDQKNKKKTEEKAPIKKIKIMHHAEEVTAASTAATTEPEAIAMEPVTESIESDVEGAPLLPGKELPKIKKSSKKPLSIKVDESEANSSGDTPLLPITVVTEDEKNETTDEVAAKTENPVQEAEEELAAFDIPEDEPAEELPVDNAETDEPAALEVPEPNPEPTEIKDELGLEDPKTDKAVEEIIAAEADELLEVQDRKLNIPPRPQFDPVPKEAAKPPVKLGSKKKNPSSKNVFSRLLASKSARKSLFVIIFAVIAAILITPSSRYFVLNSAGVRSSASITVLDETTGQPLKNAQFSIGDVSGKSDNEGNIRLSGLKLGPSTLMVQRTAFAEVTRPVTIGWGSNPLGEFRLKPTGNQYRFVVTDFLSKKPVDKVEASIGDSQAIGNAKGEVVLTIPRSEAEKDKISIELKGNGYRTEIVEISSSSKEQQNIHFVPSQKHVFISKRSGTYDLYKIDVDGKNESKVLSGTGVERPEAIALSSHPTRNITALVSVRDSSKNKNGFSLSTLTIINLDDNSKTTVAQSERIQMVGWIEGKLAYVKIAEGASEASPDRHKLVTYDVNLKTEKELASTNYFNDVLLVGNWIYYSPAAYNVNGSVGLYKINSDGSNRKTVYDKEVWNLLRTSYDKLSVSMGQEWFELNLSNDSLSRTASAPPVMKTRVYADNPEKPFSLWVDERDGKGVLLGYETQSKTDKILQSQSGLKNPVRWLTNSHIIYRVNTTQETADYVVSTEGGEPKKIRDVTDTAGIDRWYYY